MSKQKKKQKREERKIFFKEIFSTTKEELKKKYPKTLALDFILLVCLFCVMLVSAAVFYGLFLNLNEILPTTISSVSAIINNPKAAANYSDELEITKERLNLFIFGVVITIISTILLVLMIYAYFQLKIFETLEEKRTKQYWKFLVMNFILFLLFFLIAPVLIFMIKPLNAILSGIFLVFFILFGNNIYFSFMKKKEIFKSFRAAFALFGFKNIIIFIVVCAAFIVTSRILAIHQNSFILSMLIFQILYWPFGRIIIYSLNKTTIKN
jgi:hypothetical protein